VLPIAFPDELRWGVWTCTVGEAGHVDLIECACGAESVVLQVLRWRLRRIKNCFASSASRREFAIPSPNTATRFRAACRSRSRRALPTAR
jgi:hypothetical protein